ncbi:MAG TPA: adenylate/guanylate cyclase domain-containing protein [Gaiellaceae bacterium]|nr:adenylate/guanylate cyclase domain-containing protein [Gaiellaceae bacterium]
MSECTSCGASNREGLSFCTNCGASIAAACPSCGASHEPGQRFCGECGTALGTVSPAAPTTAPDVERRVVTILFADLVGFTPLSESRDAEDVRSLLTRYFDTARLVIGRYGGTVEKFIGDAVMAVWGAPTAREDDAERAVRAALDLVEAVAALDAGLQARAGVLTGEAAVTLGASGQGLVAGDLVNTASRVQSTAEPGTVLVGESTRRASEAAVVYEDAGSFELKGKTEQVPLWRALRVAAGVGGRRRSEGLEPPFVGRDRELRLVKELYHSSAEQGRSHLVSVLGIAGIGKSRLSWELFKYLDGLTDLTHWHRGRCLSYGDGVTYWALAEMARERFHIAEGEDVHSAREKLSTALAEFVPDDEERQWIEPRLAHLLGLEEERQAREKEDLFGAWRLFFERLSERAPVVLVFEDVQWADAALLEFVEYLLEWSRNHAIYVVALARPDVADRHPDWPTSRNTTTLALDPLSNEAIAQLLEGLVPGLPDDARERILARAEGVPLYAVETVRMLLDKGLLRREGDVYVPEGQLGELAVPETLHALAAARLDGLGPDERRALQDAAVLGKTFTKAGLAEVSGRSEAELEPLLAFLVRREILGLQSDPRSPELGQYGFLQDLLRQVAYETLARPERKARHLAAAAYLESTGDETVEVVASHLLSAYDADPEAADADAIRERARLALVHAGDRAAALAASAEALRYYEQALELAPTAELHERAGRAAYYAARLADARTHLEHALEIRESDGDSRGAARARVALAEVAFWDHRASQAIDLLHDAVGVLLQGEHDADLARAVAELSRYLTLAGRHDEAIPLIERSLELGEALDLTDVFAHGLITKGVALNWAGRSREAALLTRHGLEVALQNDLADIALRAYNNLLVTQSSRDHIDVTLEVNERMLELAIRVGNRQQEQRARRNMASGAYFGGDWDRAEAEAALTNFYRSSALTELRVARGQVELAREEFRADVEALEEGWDSEVQARIGVATQDAMIMLAEGKHADALARAEEALRERGALGVPNLFDALETAGAVAAHFGDVSKLEELIALADDVPGGHVTPVFRATTSLLRAHLAIVRGEDASSHFAASEQIYRDYGSIPPLATTLIEHGEWLASVGRNAEAEPLLAEAEEISARLRATAWLERIARCRARAGAAVA